MKISLFTVLIFIMCLFTYNAFCAEIEYKDPEGVRVKFNEDGSFKSIIASAEVELTFGDREDINDAKREAKLIAKAEIAKFLKESIKTDETLNKMTKSVTNQTSGQSATATKEKIKVQTINIHNSADALLKGVVTLLEDINKDEKYVRVEVGMNLKTINVANSLQIKMSQNNANSNVGSVAESNNISGREVRKSKMYNDF